MKTALGESNNNSGRRSSARLASKKDDETDGSNKRANRSSARLATTKDDGDNGANDTNDDDGATGHTSKKLKEEEADENEKWKRTLIAGYTKDLKKQTVFVGGKKMMCYDVNHQELVGLLEKHNDPNDPFGLSQRQMGALSMSRELHTDGNGNAGVRLACRPTMYENHTKIKGAPTQQLLNNLNMWITNPDNASRGNSRENQSAAAKAMVTSGKNDPRVNNGNKAKEEKLGGSPLSLLLGSELIKVVEYENNDGETCSKVMIPRSTQEGIEASDDKNIPSLLCDECGIGVWDGYCSDHNKAATHSLKHKLTQKKRQGMNMKMDDRVRDGRKSYPLDCIGWENMAMIFYFKGRASDVTQYQHSVEPADPPPN